MSEKITVSIDATKRKAIIFAALTGYIPPSLRDLPPEKLAVTDNQIKDYLCNLPASEHHIILKGPFGIAFRANGQAALDRLSEAYLAAHPETALPRNGRVASMGVIDQWEAHEVVRSNSPNAAKTRKDKK